MNSKAILIGASWLPLVLVSALLSGLAACSSLETTYDYDTEADFGALRAYGWVERSASENSSDLVYERIVASVDEELASKGYVRSDSPDFLVAAQTGSQSRVSVTDWGYDYGPYGSWWPRRDVSVQEYEVGTLILDMVEAGSQKLIWRGTAEDTLSSMPSPEQVTKTIRHAVQTMLKAFPPN